MKVEVYPDGEGHRAIVYDMPPDQAVAAYAAQQYNIVSTDVVVVPRDAEARTLSGWMTDIEGWFRLFVVSPRTTWDVTEVNTFNRSKM